MKWVVLGLCLLLAGCASVGRKGYEVSHVANSVQQQEKVDPETQRIREELKKFYAWLSQTGQLLRRVAPYDPNGDRWKPRQLDPDTLEPLPEEEPQTPSVEELTRRLNELLKDPAFRKALKEKKGPQV